MENKWIYVTLLYHARYLRVTIIQLYRDALLPLCEIRSPDSDKSNWRELNGKGGWAGDPGAALGSRSCRVIFSFSACKANASYYA